MFMSKISCIQGFPYISSSDRDERFLQLYVCRLFEVNESVIDPKGRQQTVLDLWIWGVDSQNLALNNCQLATAIKWCCFLRSLVPDKGTQTHPLKAVAWSRNHHMLGRRGREERGYWLLMVPSQSSINNSIEPNLNLTLNWLPQQLILMKLMK